MALTKSAAVLTDPILPPRQLHQRVKVSMHSLEAFSNRTETPAALLLCRRPARGLWLDRTDVIFFLHRRRLSWRSGFSSDSLLGRSISRRSVLVCHCTTCCRVIHVRGVYSLWLATKIWTEFWSQSFFGGSYHIHSVDAFLHFCSLVAAQSCTHAPRHAEEEQDNSPEQHRVGQVTNPVVESLHRPDVLAGPKKCWQWWKKNKLLHSKHSTEQTLTCDCVLADSKALSCAGGQRSAAYSD